MTSQFGKALPLIIFGSASVVAGLLALYLPETMATGLPETVEDAKHIGMKKQVHTTETLELNKISEI